MFPGAWLRTVYQGQTWLVDETMCFLEVPQACIGGGFVQQVFGAPDRTVVGVRRQRALVPGDRLLITTQQQGREPKQRIPVRHIGGVRIGANILLQRRDRLFRPAKRDQRVAGGCECPGRRVRKLLPEVLESDQGLTVMASGKKQVRIGRQHALVVRLYLSRAVDHLLGPIQLRPLMPRLHQGERQSQQRIHGAGIQGHGPFEQFLPLLDAARVRRVKPQRAGLQDQVEGIRVVGVLSLGAGARDVGQRDVRGLSDLTDEPIPPDAAARRGQIELVGPEMCLGVGLDQLHVDPREAAGLLDAALQHVPHAQRIADLARAGGFSLVDPGGRAGDDEHSGDVRQMRRKVVGDRLRHRPRHRIVARIAADIFEWQHDDR
jgi:hypothetical protein